MIAIAFICFDEQTTARSGLVPQGCAAGCCDAGCVTGFDVVDGACSDLPNHCDCIADVLQAHATAVIVEPLLQRAARRLQRDAGSDRVLLAAPSFDTDAFPELGKSTPCTRARTIMLQRTDDGGSLRTRPQTRFQTYRAARTGSCGGVRTYPRCPATQVASTCTSASTCTRSA